MSTDIDWSLYESGPFCRHWSDPSDCEEKCATCGHLCREHVYGTDSECMENGCGCEKFVEAKS